MCALNLIGSPGIGKVWEIAGRFDLTSRPRESMRNRIAAGHGGLTIKPLREADRVLGSDSANGTFSM